MTDKITFKIVYPFAQKGKEGSEEKPSPYFSLDGKSREVCELFMKDKDDVVINRDCIKVAFNFPLGQEHVLDLKPPGGQTYFTRLGIARAIADRYQDIYRKKNDKSLFDLDLHTISYLPERDLYLLGIDS